MRSRVAIEKIQYKGWRNCYRMSNGDVELVITGEVGPRIMRYAFPGRRNVFHEVPEELGKSGEAGWKSRGGHRLWVAPEVAPPSKITYAVDNLPVEIEIDGRTLTATAPVEREVGLEKQIAVTIAPRGSQVRVAHRLTNRNGWAIELAPWALTVMAPGGTGITGLPPRGTHPEQLAPTNPLVIWAFTDLSDPRWQFTRKYILLRQDGTRASPQKIGSFNADTFGAYHLGNQLFLKRYSADASKTYTDMGASFEMFTNGDMLELETLGPMTRLAPGATVEHVEHWSLHDGIGVRSWNDASLDRVLGPLLRSSLAEGE